MGANKKDFTPEKPMWVCEKCKEKIEGNFDTCWNCAGENEENTSSVEIEKTFFEKVFNFLLRFLGWLIGISVFGYLVSQMLS